MKKTKDLLLTSFATFSLFFGAGNLLLPPFLGYNAKNEWFLVSIGFMLTGVLIPILGIYAHAKLQGTLFDFAKEVSKWFGKIYCLIIYILIIVIPGPRTAAATYEVAIQPNFQISSLSFSVIYFSLVLVFVLNRSKVLNLIGKFLTPLIVVALILIIGISYFASETTLHSSSVSNPLVTGLLEGYQTFDTIAAVVVGAVIIISVNEKFDYSFKEKKTLIKKSGLLAGLGLFIIYSGLIIIGAFYGSEVGVHSHLAETMERSELLRSISINALGDFGNSILSTLIALACFTTAVGIVVGTSDYFKSLFYQSQKVYIITAIISCVIGVLIGQLNFGSILTVGFPFLLLVYPVTIVLIILNVLPQKYTSKYVFKLVIFTTVFFTIPDILGVLFPTESINEIIGTIPLAKERLGWCAPALTVFLMTNTYEYFKSKN